MQPNNQQSVPQQPTGQAPSGVSGIPQQQDISKNQGVPPTAKTAQSTTQTSLLISEIRDGMVIMTDGSFRAVVACESINFDLMSSREREGIEFSYQNFLNSLYFPVQILIRSQRVDIAPYIENLAKLRRNQDNMLLGHMMEDYIEFIEILSEEANIMDKSFYMVVPYFPSGDMNKIIDQGKGFFGKIFAKPQVSQKITTQTYTKAKEEIGNRVDAVMSGLFQMGVKSRSLNTSKLSELFYNFYNPDTAVREPLADFNTMATTFVRKGSGQSPFTTTDQGGL